MYHFIVALCLLVLSIVITVWNGDDFLMRMLKHFFLSGNHGLVNDASMFVFSLHEKRGKAVTYS